MSNSKNKADKKNIAIQDKYDELQKQNDAMMLLNDELHQSEKKFRRLIENLETEYFFYSQNLDGKYEYVSPSITKLLGYNSTEVEYGILQFLTKHPKNKLGIEASLKTKKGQKQPPFEIEIKDKYGNLKYFELLEIPIFNKKNEVKLIEGLAHEITTRRRAGQVQKILANISAAVMVSESLTKLVMTIREQLSTIIDTQNFYIALYDKATDTLSLPFIADEKDDVESFPAAQTMTGYVVKTRKTLMATFDEQEQMVKKGDIDFVGSRSQIWLGVPLMTKKEVIGVLAVQSYDDVQAYTAQDKEVLEIISNQITQAIARKNLEVQEKDQQELFDKITGSASDGIIVINDKKNIIFWNKSAERIFGYTSKEAQNSNIGILLNLDEFKKLRIEAFRRFKKSQDGSSIENTFEIKAKRKNGEEFPASISLAFAKIRNEWNVIGTVHDITNRKIAEKKLKEEKEYAERILSVVPSAVFTVDKNKIITSWNKKAEIITGWTVNETLGKPCADFSLTSCSDKCQLFEGPSKDPVTNHECKLKTKEDEEITILKSTAYLHDSEGNIIGGIESFEDISERKRTELIQKILYNISMAVNTTEDVAEFIKLIQSQLSQLLDTTNFYVAFYDSKSDMLSIAYIEDENDELDSWPAGNSLTGTVVKSKQKLFITKSEIFDLHRQGKMDIVGTTPEVWVGIPLIINGEVIGALAIQDYNDVNAYTNSDVELLEFISNQISTAIERKKAAEELKVANADLQEQKEELQQQNEENEQQNEEIRAINDEMQVMNQDLLVSEAKVRRLIENLEDEYIFYSQNINGHYEYMSPSAQKLLGYSANELKFGLETFLTKNELNKEALKNFKEIEKGQKQPTFQIEITDKYEQPRFFEILRGAIYDKNNEITHIEGIAHEITNRKKAELIQEIIGNISNAVILSEDLAGLIQMIKDELDKLLDTKNFYVALYDDKTDMVSFPFFINEKDKIASRPLGISLTDNVIKTGKSLIADVATKKRMAAEGKLVFSGSMSKIWLGVPLKLKDKVIGVISVQSYEDENAYDESDVRILEVISSQISLSIERKKVADELKATNIELNNQKEELESTLESLQDTQSQLIQSEKMAALGQLIAGIAHEINTPLGAINASVGNMSDSLDTSIESLPQFLNSMNENDLEFYLKLMSMAEVDSPEQSSKEKRQLKKEVIRLLEENNIQDADKIGEIIIYMKVHKQLEQLMPMLASDKALFILSNARNIISLRKNTQNINMAVSKASKVVFALKKFAHRDHVDEKTETDLIDGIETVLILYHNQIKQGVEVIKNYKEIPNIKCHSDELNQVWTNLFHNSLQAMNNNGSLTVSVEVEGEGVMVKIADTGSGIPEELREKVFQAFFTTKIAGEGSGLGLDIVKKIIDKHGGKIDFESEVGVGTTFMIWLPFGYE